MVKEDDKKDLCQKFILLADECNYLNDLNNKNENDYYILGIKALDEYYNLIKFIKSDNYCQMYTSEDTKTTTHAHYFRDTVYLLEVVLKSILNILLYYKNDSYDEETKDALHNHNYKKLIGAIKRNGNEDFRNNFDFYFYSSLEIGIIKKCLYTIALEGSCYKNKRDFKEKYGFKKKIRALYVFARYEYLKISLNDAKAIISIANRIMYWYFDMLIQIKECYNKEHHLKLFKNKIGNRIVEEQVFYYECFNSFFPQSNYFNDFFDPSLQIKKIQQQKENLEIPKEFLKLLEGGNKDG